MENALGIALLMMMTMVLVILLMVLLVFMQLRRIFTRALTFVFTLSLKPSWRRKHRIR